MSRVKIESVTPIQAHRVVIESEDYPYHTRYSENHWTVTMGESEESVRDCSELEAAFQAWASNLIRRIEGGVSGLDAGEQGGSGT